MGIFRHDKTGQEFDDGINAVPGDPEFTRDLAEAHFKETGFSYVGTPTYENPIAVAAQAEFEAKLAEDAAADALAAEKAAEIAATATKCKDCGATIIP